MNFKSAKSIKETLTEYGLRPSKGLGQNFLIDQNILKKIVESADIKSSDTILEVGPGMGILTKELAKEAKEVIAIEKDKKILPVLKDYLKEFKNVKIINGDILKTDIKNLKLEIRNYKVVSNIPYYITSPLIRKFLESKNPPSQIILMIQKEVALRICASPPTNFTHKKLEKNNQNKKKLVGGKTSRMNLLAVSVQYYAEPKIISHVSKNSFWPIPKVDSAIIKITPHQNIAKNSSEFFSVVKAGFSQPRKQLANNLSKSLKIKRKEVEDWLKKNNIAPNQRAETLSIENWQNLTKSKP